MSTGYDKTLESDLPIVSISGLNTNKDVYIGGNLLVAGTIGATGAQSLTTVAISGTASVGGVLSVTGVASFGATGSFGGNLAVTGTVSSSGIHYALSAAAITGTGAQAVGFSTTTTLGIYYGSGSPTIAAATGSLFLRSDGTGPTNRAFISSGGTGWTGIETAI